MRALTVLFGTCLVIGCSGDPPWSTDPVRGPAGSPTDDAGCAKPCGAASNTPGYPTCGCGTNRGDLIDNYEFNGRDGKLGVSSSRTTVRLGDFYDPDGAKGLRFLVISVAAGWCVPCRTEAAPPGPLPRLYAKYPKGVVFLTNVMQGAHTIPSTDLDVDAWLTTYRSKAWIVRDDLQILAPFLNAGLPVNMLVDLKTMRVVDLLLGGGGLDVIEGDIDVRL